MNHRTECGSGCEINMVCTTNFKTAKNPHLQHPVTAPADIVARQQRILYAQQAGPVAVHHVLLHLLLVYVPAAVPYPNARVHVVELPAVELKELYEEDAQVPCRHLLRPVSNRIKISVR